MARNQHGLQRVPPADVCRQIRRNSGFGCIICRKLICDYAHLDPPFRDALFHDADAICLLCKGHHDELDKGHLALGQVEGLYSRFRAGQKGPPVHYEMLGLTGHNPRIVLGNATFDHVPETSSFLSYDDRSYLSLKYVQDDLWGGLRPSIDAIFVDRAGVPAMVIADNVVELGAELVDAYNRAHSIHIESKSLKSKLVVEILPPTTLKITTLELPLRELTLRLSDEFAVEYPDVDGVRRKIQLLCLEASGASAAVSYLSDPRKAHLFPNEVKIVGGRGVLVGRSGLTIAKDAGRMLFPRIAFW